MSCARGTAHPSALPPLWPQVRPLPQPRQRRWTGADVIITMLSDGFATATLFEDAAFVSALSAKPLWLDMSSAKPEHARALSERLAAHGVACLDAPVSGGTKGAEAASLAIMVGGAAEAFDAARPVFEAMGRPVHVGPSGCGQLAKLANQTIVAVTIGAVAGSHVVD